MSRVRYTYRYKTYPDCPEATDCARFWADPRHGWIVSFPFSVIPFALSIYVYNTNGHQSNVLSITLLLIGLVVFMVGGSLVPSLFKKLRISDRVYEKKTGKKAS